MGQTELRILTVSKANKRDQLLRGINESKGSIMALIDDDAFWARETILLHLLAPFQQEDIGLVGGPITSYLPLKRQYPGTIMPWEVAAIRLRGKRLGSMKSAYAADGGINFCVSDVTALLRSEIARDPAFQSAFANDNSGDDSFITRWILFQHLFKPQRRDGEEEPVQRKLGMQLTEGAEVGTSIMPD
ncbi:hypothetical protein FOPE_07652 [Fonsecaea pedrosoi]|nr:hypothetical protein FOPE_07652 [Fonsecaea pedrosoi]